MQRLRSWLGCDNLSNLTKEKRSEGIHNLLYNLNTINDGGMNDFSFVWQYFSSSGDAHEVDENRELAFAQNVGNKNPNDIHAT
jgi:hypothetical protein